MRGPRPFIVATCYLAALALVSFGLYALMSTSTRGSATGSETLGKLFFATVSVIELGLICVIAPALTADLISGERERRTFDLLLVTPLTRGQIVFGKLASGMGSLLLLIVLAAPIQSVAVVLGGVGTEELAVGFALLILTAVTYGCAGLFWSARVKSTRAAVALAYATTALGVIGLPVALLVLVLVSQTVDPSLLGIPGRLMSGREALSSLLVAQAIASVGQLVVASNPVFTAVLSASTLAAGKDLLMTERLGGQEVVLIAPWLLFGLVHALAAAAFVIMTSHCLRPTQSR